MAYETSFRDIQVRSTEIGIRTIGLNDLWQALKEGYDDFNAMPTLGVFLAVLYPLFALLLTLLLVGNGKDLLHLAFPMVAGLTLIGPAVSVFLFELSRRRERGLDVRWRSAFDFVHTGSFAPILALSILMMLLYLAWLFMAQFLYFGLFGEDIADLGVRFCEPAGDDPTGRCTDSVWSSPRVPVCRRCAGNFRGRLSAAPGQTGKRRYSRRHLDQGGSCQFHGHGSLGSHRCCTARCGGHRVPARPRGGPANSGSFDVASLPQSR